MSKNYRWRHPLGQTRAQAAIVNRLDEIGRNTFSAALAVGLRRTFIYEFSTGKKRSFSSDSLAKVAKALDWDVNELVATLSEKSDKVILTK